MLDLGVDPNSKDKHGNTIVIVGAQNGNKQIVKLALRYGGHINMTNTSGNTALHYCSEYGYVELGAYLMSKGASQDIINIKAELADEESKEDQELRGSFSERPG